MDHQRTIVILGGAQAGPTAAARARETDENARIVLIERAREVSYAAAGLAYHLSGEVASLDQLNRERAAKFQDEFAIEVRTGVEVTRIDAAGRAVELGGERLPYDSLVYALGAESKLPEALPPAKNVFRFRTLVDLAGIVAALAAGKRKVAVLGGGFFGVEAADGLSRRGCAVVLVEREARILGAFSPTVAALANDALSAQGVRVLAGARLVEARVSEDEVTELVLAGGERLAVDLVIATAGIVPRTSLLVQAGARLERHGSLAVDDRMRVAGLAGVYACGVCASVKHRLTGESTLVAQASVADKTAQIAGANAAGADQAMPPVLGTALVRAGKLLCARTGLPWDAPGVAVTRVQAPSGDAWFPGSTPLHIELRLDHASGRLLGADVAGEQGADKRIDVLAAAIAGELSAVDLANLDLGYCPPFSAARDGLNLAASIAASEGRANLRAVSPAELLVAARDFVVVDVRDQRGATDDLVALPGARQLPLRELRGRLAELPASGKLLFVDDSGRLAYLAAGIAAQRGRPAGWLSGGLRALELSRRAE